MYSDVLALMSVGGIGPVTYHHLISRFKKPERVFGQTRRNLLECPGVTQQMADEIITGQFRNVYRNQLAWIKRHNARVLTLYDGEYPVILKQIFDPPPMLMIIGEIYPDDDFSLAVVGTRNPDDYGKRCADRITTGIVKAGITVVSGLARGIDAAAHHAALKRGGRTLAVLGTGLDRQYPQENSALYRQIPKNGAIISENCIGMRQKPGNFVRRNRIISGLSRGVVVVQAGHRSGAVTTALFANEQNRDVFTVPGDIYKGLNAGCHRLIRLGAKAVEKPEDVLSEYPDHLKKDSRQINLLSRAAAEIKISKSEQTLLNCLDNEPKHMDSVIEKIDMNRSEIMSAILNLELKGYIERHTGNYFTRKI